MIYTPRPRPQSSLWFSLHILPVRLHRIPANSKSATRQLTQRAIRISICHRSNLARRQIEIHQEFQPLELD